MQGVGAGVSTGAGAAPLPQPFLRASVASTVEDDDADVPSDDAPPAAASAPQVFSSIQEVEEWWDAQARHLASVCALDLPAAHHVLRAHAYDVPAAIRACLLKVRLDS